MYIKHSYVITLYTRPHQMLQLDEIMFHHMLSKMFVYTIQKI